MRPELSGKAAALVPAVALAGLAAMSLGLEPRLAAPGMLAAWVLIALAALARIDAASYRIDPWWLACLVVAALLWQAHASWPAPEDGLLRALGGAAAGFALGAAPLLAAEALGRRWPFSPGDVLLFSGLGVLVGARGLLWVLALGGLASLARHVCVRRLRGRSWREGHVPLGPGMAMGAIAVFLAMNLAPGYGT